jgi:hypothetical protein
MWLWDATTAFGWVFVITLVVRCSVSCLEDLLNHFRAALRRVLHLNMVLQLALLEDFGILLVLADKVCHYV